MNRPARTLTRDLVRRRHPTGASPSRRIAPGRTLSPMPSEQKGAYGGDLAPSVVRHGENDGISRRTSRGTIDPVEGSEGVLSIGRQTELVCSRLLFRRPFAREAQAFSELPGAAELDPELPHEKPQGLIRSLVGVVHVQP